ncbi:MAG: carboxypeptidase-like regulatory domain-containing protein [Moheibacter sp.]
MKNSILMLATLLISTLLIVSNFKNEGLTGTVQDPSGFSIEKSSLEIYPKNGSNRIYETETAEDGSFVFPSLPKGEYEMVVKALGYKEKTKSFQLNKSTGDLGVIQLEENFISLDAVVIYGKKSPKKNFAGFGFK